MVKASAIITRSFWMFHMDSIPRLSLIHILALLGYIGGKMLWDGIKGEEAEEAAELRAGALLMQGVATSIDALSVGFTISEYGWLMARCV